MMVATVLLWVESLLGSGHLRRAVTIANAIAADGPRVVLATGGEPAWPLGPSVELAPLAPVRAADATFSALVDQAGRPVDDAWRAARRDRLLDLAARLRPRVLITEMFPFGRSAFAFELLPLIEAVRGRTRIVASVRDVLVHRDRPERLLRMRDLALAHYHRVLVHSDPKVMPFAHSFPHADALGARLVHTGYVVETAPVAPAPGAPEVVVSAGGGAVGLRLLETAIAARPHTRLADAPWRLIAGRHVPEAGFAALRAQAGDGIVVERTRDDFQALLARALLSISQAGYNTVVEALRFGRPMVLVPFATGAETEQTTRAERLVALGLAHMIRERELAAETLAGAVDRALARPSAGSLAVDVQGAARTARLVARLAHEEW